MQNLAQQLINYLLHLADTTLILSQRNSEWCGHGPVLEQDIAITKIGTTGGNDLVINGSVIPLNELRTAHTETFPKLFG